jgi:hypothetical protein
VTKKDVFLFKIATAGAFSVELSYNIVVQVVMSARDQLQGVDVAKLRLMATQLETIVSMFNVVMSDTSLFASYEQALFDQTLQKISQVCENLFHCSMITEIQ